MDGECRGQPKRKPEAESLPFPAMSRHQAKSSTAEQTEFCLLIQLISYYTQFYKDLQGGYCQFTSNNKKRTAAPDR